MKHHHLKQILVITIITTAQISIVVRGPTLLDSWAKPVFAETIQSFCSPSPNVSPEPLRVALYIENTQQAAYRDTPPAGTESMPLRLQFAELLGNALWIDGMVRGVTHTFEIYTYDEIPRQVFSGELTETTIGELHNKLKDEKEDWLKKVEDASLKTNVSFNELFEKVFSDRSESERSIVVLLNDMAPNGLQSEDVDYAHQAKDKWNGVNKDSRRNPLDPLYMFNFITQIPYAQQWEVDGVIKAWKDDFFSQAGVLGAFRDLNGTNLLHEIQRLLEEVTGQEVFHTLTSYTFENPAGGACPFAETEMAAVIVDIPHEEDNDEGTTPYTIMAESLEAVFKDFHSEETKQVWHNGLYAVRSSGGLEQLNCPAESVAGGADVKISWVGNLDVDDAKWASDQADNELPADINLPEAPVSKNDSFIGLGPLPLVMEDVPLRFELYNDGIWNIFCSFTVVSMPDLEIRALNYDHEAQAITATVVITNAHKLGGHLPQVELILGNNEPVALTPLSSPKGDEGNPTFLDYVFKAPIGLSPDVQPALFPIVLAASYEGITVDNIPVKLHATREWAFDLGQPIPTLTAESTVVTTATLEATPAPTSTPPPEPDNMQGPSAPAIALMIIGVLGLGIGILYLIEIGFRVA